MRTLIECRYAWMDSLVSATREEECCEIFVDQWHTCAGLAERDRRGRLLFLANRRRCHVNPQLAGSVGLRRGRQQQAPGGLDRCPVGVGDSEC